MGQELSRSRSDHPEPAGVLAVNARIGQGQGEVGKIKSREHGSGIAEDQENEKSRFWEAIQDP